MSTNVTPCFIQTDFPCDCTYSTIAGAFTATTVATKVGNDFQFYGLRGINGATVLLNGSVIEISGGGASSASLQTAYNNGNQIVISGNGPVDIRATSAPAFTVHDTTATGLFSIDTTPYANTGDAIIRFSNRSGIKINSPIQLLAPTYQDPYSNILSFAPPTAATVTSTIVAAASIGAATSANSIFQYNVSNVVPAVPTPANTVTRIKIQVVGNATNVAGMFSFEVNARLAPGSVQQVLLGSVSSEIDPSLATLTVDVKYSSNTIDFMLIGGPNPGTTTYLARGTAIITMMQY